MGRSYHPESLLLSIALTNRYRILFPKGETLIIYLDTSALLKRYVREPGSDVVKDWLTSAEFVGSSILTRPEMVSALSRAVKGGYLSFEQALELRKLFYEDWSTIAEIAISELLISRAEALAWEYKLRGYDSVHLAAALLWQEMLQASITLVTFDRQLWEAGQQTGLQVLPANI
jgi:predicted nucleic acid-binding protein